MNTGLDFDSRPGIDDFDSGYFDSGIDSGINYFDSGYFDSGIDSGINPGNIHPDSRCNQLNPMTGP